MQSSIGTLCSRWMRCYRCSKVGCKKVCNRELKVESRWLAGALRRRPVASNQAAAVLHQTAHRCEEGTSEGNIADNVAEGAHVRRTPTLATGLCACIGFAPCLLLIGLLVVGFNCTIAHIASHCTPSQRAATIALPVDLTWPIDLIPSKSKSYLLACGY